VNSLVSIIIPAYNAERYIAETIESVINQTYKNWELIIVDDGSIDNTALIIQTYLINPRVQYKYQHNSGVSITRNNGIKFSKGDYIAFLDADDVWTADYLEYKIYILNQHLDVGVVTSNGQLIDRNSNKLKLRFKGLDENAIKDIIEFKKGYDTSPSNIVCKKEVVGKIKGFNTELSNAADKLFILKAALITKIYCVKKELIFYRIHPNNMSNNSSLMVSDYIKLFTICDQNNLFQNKSHRNKCWARMYKICAADSFKNKKYANGFILSAKMLFTNLIPAK
jgi:glycosyltransferase involved in cell wall biosynthesis